MRKIMTATLCAVVLTVASSTAFAANKKPKTLYDDLGKTKGITKVVDMFVGNVGGDKRINGQFAATVADKARLAKFKKNLVDQICQASGGPCKYTGKDMKTAHAGMGITSADFTALVEDLVAALDKAGVKPDAKDKLLGALGGMKGDIVEKP
jgi:hemoglobin